MFVIFHFQVPISMYSRVFFLLMIFQTCSFELQMYFMFENIVSCLLERVRFGPVSSYTGSVEIITRIHF